MNQSGWTVERHLRDKPPAVVDLYRRFVELVESCGPVDYAISKTAITLDLQRRVEDPRIRRAGPYTKRLFVHQFRIRTPEQLDEEFAGWVREAYVVGQGGHLGQPPDA